GPLGRAAAGFALEGAAAAAGVGGRSPVSFAEFPEFGRASLGGGGWTIRPGWPDPGWPDPGWPGPGWPGPCDGDAPASGGAAAATGPLAAAPAGRATGIGPLRRLRFFATESCAARSARNTSLDSFWISAAIRPNLTGWY